MQINIKNILKEIKMRVINSRNNQEIKKDDVFERIDEKYKEYILDCGKSNEEAEQIINNVNNIRIGEPTSITSIPSIEDESLEDFKKRRSAFLEKLSSLGIPDNEAEAKADKEIVYYGKDKGIESFDRNESR